MESAVSAGAGRSKRPRARRIADPDGDDGDDQARSPSPGKRRRVGEDDEYRPPDADASDSSSSSSAAAAAAAAADDEAGGHAGAPSSDPPWNSIRQPRGPGRRPGAAATAPTAPGAARLLPPANPRGRAAAAGAVVPLPAYLSLRAEAIPADERSGAAQAYRSRVRQLTAADHPTDVGVRLTIRKRLGEALEVTAAPSAQGPAAGEVRPDIVAAEIEEALFLTSGSAVNDGYKQKFRRLEFNLKDPKNGALRHQLLGTVVTPTQLLAMRPEDLANPALREEYRKLAEYKVQEKLADKETRVASDTFRCGKCGARKCTYTQLQVRRADEPMTTFVECIVRNNRWRC